MKADPVLNDYLLEKERNRKRARTRKRQDQNIQKTAKNIWKQYCIELGIYNDWHSFSDLTAEVKSLYYKLATAALYPERLLK